jgi:hypothetical protein
MNVLAALIALVLKLPHRPRSADDERAAPCRRRAAPALVEQRMRRRSTRVARLFEHAQHLDRERARLLDALLRAAQPRRGDHLHRLRDLLRRLDRADAPPDV